MSSDRSNIGRAPNTWDRLWAAEPISSTPVSGSRPQPGPSTRPVPSQFLAADADASIPPSVRQRMHQYGPGSGLHTANVLEPSLSQLKQAIIDIARTLYLQYTPQTVTDTHYDYEFSSARPGPGYDDFTVMMKKRNNPRSFRAGLLRVGNQQTNDYNVVAVGNRRDSRRAAAESLLHLLEDSVNEALQRSMPNNNRAYINYG